MTTSGDPRPLSLSGIPEIFSNSVRLSRMIWRARKGTVVALTIVFLLVSATPFLLPAALGLLLNRLATPAAPGGVTSLAWLTGLVIAATVLPPILSAIQVYIDHFLLFYLEEELEILLISKQGEIDAAVHESPRRSDLISRVQENGVARVQWFVNRQFSILQNLVEVLIAVLVLAWANGWLLLALFVGTLPELMTEARYGRMVWSIQVGRAEIRRRFLDLRAHFLALAPLFELKLFQNVGHLTSRLHGLFGIFLAEERRSERRKLGRLLLSLAVSQSVIALAIAWFTLQVVQGRMQVGTFTFLLASIGGLRISLSSLFTNLGRQYQDSLFVSDVFQFLDLEPVIEPPPQPVVLAADRPPSIVFEDVTFAYPETGRLVLERLSLDIHPGEKLALVGANGAGKTTLIKLLCRFYDPDAGRILVNGHDLRTIDLASWYGQLGVLLQDYAFYRFPVNECIGMGDTSRPLSPEDVVSAARKSESDLFIETWTERYEQMLGRQFSGGIEPSAGQWQKLALARSFYRDPRLFIFDEPTSSIDADGEARIFERLESLGRDQGVILISHRFSTVRNADRICVLEDRTIKEIGSHDELLRRGGTYARLFQLQARGYR